MHIYEFLYRGNRDSKGEPTYHVILMDDAVGSDPFGRPLAPTISDALTPEQAAKLGFPLPALLSEINAATMAELTAAKEEAAVLKGASDAAIAERDQLQAQVVALTEKLTPKVDAAMHLPKWKFWAVLEIAGKAQPLRDAVAAIADPTQRAIIGARLEHTEIYDRNDPLFSDAGLLAAMKMTTADVDALWVAALALPG